MIHVDSILVCAAHTDDGEFGCGGAINKWVGEGREIYYVAFSCAEKSVPAEYPKDILKTEVRKATQSMGIPGENLIIYEYPVRDFPQYRQDILENMITLGSRLKPDLVLLPSTKDTHQDHQVVSQEGFRAFKKTSMIGYEMPYNNLTFSTDLFVELTKGQLDEKTRALECYESQKHRTYATTEFIESLARVRGVQIGVVYAEAFEIIRWIVR